MLISIMQVLGMHRVSQQLLVADLGKGNVKFTPFAKITCEGKCLL